jgi:CheY-like chemotaxis protein
MGQLMDDATLAAEIIAGADQAAESEPQWPYVLVVDDQQVVRDFLKRCLEGWGYSVKQAGSAAIALEVMTASPATVIFCDVKMPIHDGLWLVERLRARWPEVPIVMITSAQDEETIASSRTLGAFDYLTKPISPKQLRDAVERASALNHPEPAPPVAPDHPSLTTKDLHTQLGKIEAEYSLECPVRCPTCSEILTTVKAVRLLRARVNFTSTLPRRGRLIVCPHCLAVIPAELSNF